MDFAAAGAGVAAANEVAVDWAFAPTTQASSSMYARIHVRLFIQLNVRLCSEQPRDGNTRSLVTGAEKNSSVAGPENKYLTAVADLPSL